MRSLLVFPLLLAMLPAAPTPDRLIGLLTLPEVFGDGPCDTFAPRKVLLYPARNESRTVGSIQVDKHWTFPAEGGCEGLDVKVHHEDGRVSELPTEEYEYEAPAAIVLEQQGHWFRLRLLDGSAWVQASDKDEFFSLQKLLLTHNELTHFTEAWDRRLASSPGGSLSPVASDSGRRLIGYLEPVVNQVAIPIHPGQDPEQVRKRYGFSMGSVTRPDGTITFLYFDEGVPFDVYERPDRDAPVVMRLMNDDAGQLRGLSGASPPPIFVFDRRPGWVQVARRNEDSRGWLKEPRFWIEDTSAWRFTPVTEPGERERLATRSWGPEYSDVRVTDVRRVGTELWLHLELLSDSICDIEKPLVVGTGWAPAHGPAGEPTVWFFSRGC